MNVASRLPKVFAQHDYEHFFIAVVREIVLFIHWRPCLRLYSLTARFGHQLFVNEQCLFCWEHWNTQQTLLRDDHNVVVHACSTASIFLHISNSITRELCVTVRHHPVQRWYPLQAEVFPLALVSTKHLSKLAYRLGVRYTYSQTFLVDSCIILTWRPRPFSLALFLSWRPFGREVAGPSVSSHPWCLQHFD